MLLGHSGDDFTASADARTPKPLSVPAGAIPKNQLHKESSSLFMGNLPFDASEEEIRDFVETNVKAHRKETRGEKGDNEDEAEGSGSENDDDSDDGSNDSDEEDESEAEAEGAEKKPHVPTTKCGLKKVRMPTFEDSGKCKG